MYIYTNIHTHTHTHTETQRHTHKHIYICVCVCVCVCVINEYSTKGYWYYDLNDGKYNKNSPEFTVEISIKSEILKSQSDIIGLFYLFSIAYQHLMGYSKSKFDSFVKIWLYNQNNQYFWYSAGILFNHLFVLSQSYIVSSIPIKYK